MKEEERQFKVCQRKLIYYSDRPIRKGAEERHLSEYEDINTGITAFCTLSGANSQVSSLYHKENILGDSGNITL